MKKKLRESYKRGYRQALLDLIMSAILIVIYLTMFFAWVLR